MTRPNQNVAGDTPVVDDQELSEQSFLGDPHFGGLATDVRIVAVKWGRLVDVYGQSETGAAVLMLGGKELSSHK